MNDQPDPNAAMRTRSGQVRDARPLVSFLYLMLRDHVVPGAAEEMMEQIEGRPAGTDVVFTNGWLAEYAQDLAARLTGDDGYQQLLADGMPLGAAVPPRIEDHTVADAPEGQWWHDAGGTGPEPLALVRPNDRPDVPKMMCRSCKAANPDLRRSLLEGEARIQICWYCHHPLPDLPADVPETMMAPADPSKGEEPCGQSDRTGRLVCTLPSDHAEHEPIPVNEVGDDQCGEHLHRATDEAKAIMVCGKPRGHERHGAEGAL